MAGHRCVVVHRDHGDEAALRARRLNNQLRELRVLRNWSQAELGMRVGVSRQAIIAIESNRFDPSLPLAFKLARVFGVTIEDIFHDDEEQA
ncbi:MAG TPA: helix-turn-helix transcriptional regulator [Longimicrobiales bacterium]|nr:helix-turn-helix transcriptional regulator [Longimicrobiales bacterium]